MRTRWLATVLLLVASGLAGCQHAAPPPSASVAWEAYVDAFIESSFESQPQFAVWAGRHEYDGKLPDWSPAGLGRRLDLLHAERARAAAFDDKGLDARQRFERDHLVAQIDGSLFWMEKMQWYARSPTFYGWALAPDVYVSRPYAPLPQRLRAYIAYAKAVPQAATQIRGNLRLPMPRTYLQRGRLLFGGLASFYEKEVPGIFAAVQDEALQAELRTVNAAAIRAMKDLDEWLASHERETTDAFALGEARFSEMLWASERIDTPLPVLRRTAERDLARNTAALEKACAAYAPGQALAACVGRMEARKPAGSSLDAARVQLVALKAFVEQQKLVTIPGTEQALVAWTPPYARYNNAQIDIPGPFEKDLPSTYQIAPPDPSWTAAERDGYILGEADLLFVSAHEVWPGHFLQHMHASRSPSRLAQLFGSYAYSEGWAHYTEELMWDAGLGQGDPETHIGMLVNALRRNVRLLSALGMHTGTMTVAESERMFREQAFQDPATARQQAARGTIDPGYGYYTLGKLMIRKLRDDWSASRGGRAAWQAFHDEFLRYGSPPIPLLRKAMMPGDSGPLLE